MLRGSEVAAGDSIDDAIDKYEQQKFAKRCFPAAGPAPAFFPATKASPKEMLPLVDKPLIQYGVEEAVAIRHRADPDHHRSR